MADAPELEGYTFLVGVLQPQAEAAVGEFVLTTSLDATDVET